MCVLCACLEPVKVRRLYRVLQLELWVIRGHHEGPGNWFWVLCKSNKYTRPLSHPSSSPTLLTHKMSSLPVIGETETENIGSLHLL